MVRAHSLIRSLATTHTRTYTRISIQPHDAGSRCCGDGLAGTIFRLCRLSDARKQRTGRWLVAGCCCCYCRCFRPGLLYGPLWLQLDQGRGTRPPPPPPRRRRCRTNSKTRQDIWLANNETLGPLSSKVAPSTDKSALSFCPFLFNSSSSSRDYSPAS